MKNYRSYIVKRILTNHRKSLW